jgi:hypothetical protein
MYPRTQSVLKALIGLMIIICILDFIPSGPGSMKLTGIFTFLLSGPLFLSFVALFGLKGDHPRAPRFVFILATIIICVGLLLSFVVIGIPLLVGGMFLWHYARQERQATLQ